MTTVTAPAVPSAVSPVFVVGPPRSGTTLVRVVLNRHPDLHVLSETHLWDLWVARHPGLRTGDRAAFSAYWTAFTSTDGFRWLDLPPDEVPRLLDGWGRWDDVAVMTALLEAARRRHGVDRVGEKTPDHARHLDRLLGGFPDARVVHVVRDPRATVASELRHDAAWTSDDPVVAARRWARGVTSLVGAAEDPRIHVVRYEDLVTRPEATLGRLCGHVGLELTDAMLAPGPGHPDYVHGSRDPWGGIDPGSLHSWRDQLDGVTLARIAPVVAHAAARLGYPAPDEGVGAGARLVASTRRAAGRLRRPRHAGRHP